MWTPRNQRLDMREPRLRRHLPGGFPHDLQRLHRVSRLVAGGLAEQPSQGGRLPSPDAPPCDDAPQTRPRQRHVKQPHVLGEALQPLLAAFRIRRRQVQHFGETGVIPHMELGIPRIAPRRATHIPCKRQEDDGKLQALAAVNRDDLHQLLVALQTQLRHFVAFRHPPPATAEPRRDTGWREAARRLRLLQQIREMHDVGEPAGTVGMSQQLPRPTVGRSPRRGGGGIETLQQLPNHRRHPTAVPSGAPLAQALLPSVPNVVVIGQAGEFGGIQAEQVAGQRATHAPRGMGTRDGPQQAFKLLGFAALKNVISADFHAAHTAHRQSARHAAALLAGSHEHGDV